MKLLNTLAVIAVFGLTTMPAGAATIFDQLRDSAPRSVFDDIRDAAPRTVFDDIRDSAPVSKPDVTDTLTAGE